MSIFLVTWKISLINCTLALFFIYFYIVCFLHTKRHNVIFRANYSCMVAKSYSGFCSTMRIQKASCLLVIDESLESTNNFSRHFFLLLRNHMVSTNHQIGHCSSFYRFRLFYRFLLISSLTRFRYGV